MVQGERASKEVFYSVTEEGSTVLSATRKSASSA